MGYKEEPDYKVFDYKCGKCGAKFSQASSIKLHPDWQDCPFCNKIVATLTGSKVWPVTAKG